MKWRNVIVWLIVVAAIAAFPREAQCGFVDKDGKLITWGWSTPTTPFTKTYVSSMEQIPFDGMTFDIRGNTGDTSFGQQLFGTALLSAADYSTHITAAKTTNFQKFTDNFLYIWAGITTHDIDWYSPAVDNISANARTAGWIARECGCKGVVFDIEAYYTYIWQYSSRPNHQLHTLSAYQQQVRQRGREFMQALATDFPDIKVMISHGYWIRQLELGQGYTAENAPYGLLSSFYDGMLDVASANVVIHDGWEFAYGYKAESEFWFGYDVMKNQGLGWTANPTEYANHYRPAFNVWIDCVDTVHPVWSPDNTSGNYFSPNEFEYSLQRGFNLADRYEWVYSQAARWFKYYGAGQYMSQAYIDALGRLKKKGKLERFDGATKDLVTWQQYSSTGNPNATISYANNALVLDAQTGQSNEDYTTQTFPVNVGDTVSVEVTPTGAAMYGQGGLFLTDNSGGTAGRTPDDSRWLSVQWNNDNNVIYARYFNGSDSPMTLLNSDHPLNTTYVYQIARTSATTAVFGVYDASFNKLAEQTLTFSGMPNSLYVSLYAGSARMAFDNLWVVPPVPPTATVKGMVTLRDYTDTLTDMPVTLEVCNPGDPTPLETRVVYLDGVGRYSFSTTLTGLHDVAAKSPQWLKKRQMNLNLTGTVTVNFTLTNGDCDNDNLVSSSDLAVILGSFGLAEGAACDDGRADINGSHTVDETDLAIVLANLDANGD